MHKLVISTIVWGKYYKNFINYCIPTLLTKGNLRNKDIVFQYHICTDSESRQKISESNAFIELEKLGKVIFYPFSDINESSITEKVNQFTGITINEAFIKKMIHFIVTPDAIFSKNYLLKNLQILDTDIQCIASPGSRVSTKIFDELDKLKSNQAIEISSINLSGLALKFKNKWSDFNEIDSKYRSHFSSGITLTEQNRKYRLSIGHKTTPILFYVKKTLDYKKFGSIDYALPTMITHPKNIYLPTNPLEDEFHYGLHEDDGFLLKEGVHFVKEKLTILGFALQWSQKYFSGEEYLLRQIVIEISDPSIVLKSEDLKKIKYFQTLSLMLIFLFKLIHPLIKLKSIYILFRNLIKRIFYKLKRLI